MLDSKRVPVYAVCLIMIAVTAACAAPPSTQSPPLPTLATQDPLLPAATEEVILTATLVVTVADGQTPEPTPTPLHPFAIEAMRAREYPGSNITIEEILTPGSNYQRYIVSYQSDGLKIYALMTVPDGEKPPTGWPVIVFNHGYISPEQYRTTERYVAYQDALARAGYITFKSDYRGHGNSEGTPSGHFGPGYTIDVLNAVGSLKKYADADPNRIGMWGHSLGGEITLRAMVVSGEITAGVIWAGTVAPPSEQLGMWGGSGGGHGAPSAPRELTEQFGTPQENPEFWTSLSATSYLGYLSGPIQLQHGEADQEVPLGWSQALYEAINQAGKVVELYTYPGSDHNISQGFDLAMQRTIDFFNTYTKGTGR
jgi:dipeptidyl aminopeptidase/acylaminoacyl peptidase